MKNVIYYLSNQGVNWSLIWSDVSIYVCLLLFCLLILVFVMAMNYKTGLRDDYLLRTTVKLSQLTVQIDQLTEENKKLSQSVRKRDEKGHFLKATGKGHGKRDWTAATSEELIKEAKRRYKKGSTIICMYDNSEVTLIDKEFEFCVGLELWGHGSSCNALVYNSGTWAKKVPAIN